MRLSILQGCFSYEKKINHALVKRGWQEVGDLVD